LTRPFAELLAAHPVSMFSSYSARPNCVTPLPAAVAWLLQWNTLALSL
jgi:hypothetical protein